jgi:hypothetical protein
MTNTKPLRGRTKAHDLGLAEPVRMKAFAHRANQFPWIEASFVRKGAKDCVHERMLDRGNCETRKVPQFRYEEYLDWDSHPTAVVELMILVRVGRNAAVGV